MIRLLRLFDGWLCARTARRTTAWWVPPPPVAYVPRAWVAKHHERSTR